MATPVTSSSSALDDATAILLARLREVEGEARQLRAALTAIGSVFPHTVPGAPAVGAGRPIRDAAADAADGSSPPAPVSDHPAARASAEPGRRAMRGDRMSMRERVLSVLRAEDRYMTPAEIAEVIEALGHRDRKKSDAQFSASVRTALWQLRNSGDVLAGANGQNIAMTWVLHDRELDHPAPEYPDTIEPSRTASADVGESGEEGE